jgi:hypothetical protein
LRPLPEILISIYNIENKYNYNKKQNKEGWEGDEKLEISTTLAQKYICLYIILSLKIYN